MNCGRIEDVDIDEALEELESKVSKKSKYRILGRRFELYGYCSECQSKLA